MLRLDLNKWLLGSGCCTALGVAAGFVYLYDSPAESMLVSQQWYQQPLLLFFSGMLLLALLPIVGGAVMAWRVRGGADLPLAALGSVGAVLLGMMLVMVSSAYAHVLRLGRDRGELELLLTAPLPVATAASWHRPRVPPSAPRRSMLSTVALKSPAMITLSSTHWSASHCRSDRQYCM